MGPAPTQRVYAGKDAVTAGTALRPDAAILNLELASPDDEGVARALRSAFPDAPLLLIAMSGNPVETG